jgi:hypothetical protein
MSNKINMKDVIREALSKRVAFVFSLLVDAVVRYLIEKKPELDTQSKRTELSEKVMACIEQMEKDGELTSYDMFEGQAFVDSVYVLSNLRIETPGSLAVSAEEQKVARKRSPVETQEPSMYAYLWENAQTRELVASVAENPLPLVKALVDTPPNVKAGLYAMYPVEMTVQLEEIPYTISTTDRKKSEDETCLTPTPPTFPTAEGDSDPLSS